MLHPNLPRPSVKTYTIIQHTDTCRQHSSSPAHNFPHLPLTSHAEQNNFQIWPNRGKKKRQIVRIRGALLCFDDLLPQLNIPQSCGFMREPQVGIWEQESAARVSLHQHVNVLLGLIKAAHARFLQRLPDFFSNAMVNVDLERKNQIEGADIHLSRFNHAHSGFFSTKIQVLLCYFSELQRFEHQHTQARTTLSHKNAIFFFFFASSGLRRGSCQPHWPLCWPPAGWTSRKCSGLCAAARLRSSTCRPHTPARTPRFHRWTPIAGSPGRILRFLWREEITCHSCCTESRL